MRDGNVEWNLRRMALRLLLVGILLLSVGFMYSWFTSSIQSWNASLMVSVPSVIVGTSFAMLIAQWTIKPGHAQTKRLEDRELRTTSVVWLALGLSVLLVWRAGRRRQ